MSSGLLRSTFSTWTSTAPARLGQRAWKAAPSTSRHDSSASSGRKQPEGSPPLLPLSPFARSTPDPREQPVDNGSRERLVLTPGAPRQKDSPAVPDGLVRRTRLRKPSEDDAGSSFRSVYLGNLPPSTQPADITQAIAAIGPIGMVLSVRLLRAVELRKGHINALVEFDRELHADDLTRAGQRGQLVVNGVRPWVQKHRRKLPPVLRAVHYSRVVRVVGPPDTPGFTEQGLLAVLMADADVIARFRTTARDNFFGFDCEPAREGIVDDGSGRKMIELAFFSHDHQAKPFVYALRRYFGDQLEIDYGTDPCAFRRHDAGVQNAGGKMQENTATIPTSTTPSAEFEWEVEREL